MIRRPPYILLAIFVILLISNISYSQSSSSTARRVISGTSLPATCLPTGNNIFYKTDTATLYTCSATNTWSPIASTSAATFGITNYIEFTETAAPAQPAANNLRLYAKAAGGTNSLYFKKDDGTEVDLSAAGGTGLTSLNAQTGATQTFINDTNVTIVSAADAHVITWSGTLAKARIIGTAVFNDQSNTFSTGSQSFVGATNVIFGNGNLLIRDAGNDHNLIITPGTDLSVNRILTITTGDAARTVTLSGNPTLNDWFDQNVKTTGTPTFGTIDTGQGANELFDMDQNVLTTSNVTFNNLILTGTFTLPDNIRVTFNPGVDASGLNVGSVATDPGTPSNGDIHYDSDDHLLRARINGAWVSLGAGGGGSPGGSGTELQFRGGASTFSAVTGSSVSSGQITLADKLTTTLDNATTNAADTLLDIQHSTSDAGGPLASFGSRIRFGLESSTTTNQDAAAIGAIWTTATHASRTSALVFSVVNNAGALGEAMRLRGDGFLEFAHTKGIAVPSGSQLVLSAPSTGSISIEGASVTLGAWARSNRNTIQSSGITVTEAGFPLMDLAVTWNASGVTHDGIKLNVTNTASAAGSKLFDIQIGSTSKFNIQKDGLIGIDQTITGGGTTGNQTINKAAGTVNFAAAASSLTVTNSLVTTSSTIYVTPRTNDATCVIKNVVPSAGSFVITMTTTCTAETSVGFLVIN
jgi:hypothetical protein